MKYNLQSLNLDSNARVNQGFIPSTITDVDWEIINAEFDLNNCNLIIYVKCTSNNFDQVRQFLYKLSTSVESMSITELNDLILNEDEFKDSSLIT